MKNYRLWQIVIYLQEMQILRLRIQGPKLPYVLIPYNKRIIFSLHDILATMGKGARAAANNRSNQMNSNNSAYHSSRASTKAMRDNRSNQLNPSSDAYAKSRGGSSDQYESSYGAPRFWNEPYPGPPQIDTVQADSPERGEFQDKLDSKRINAEVLAERASSVSWAEFSEILNSAIEDGKTEYLLDAVMKGGAKLPDKELAETITRIMVEGPLYVQYHIIPYTDANLLVDILLEFDWRKMPPKDALGPDYNRFYVDYIGYHIARNASHVLQKLIDALSEGAPERQFRAANLIRKCKDPNLALPDIHKY